MAESDNAAANRELFTGLILTFGGEKRFTQDTPIRPEVWAAYAFEPLGADGAPARHDLILTPHFKANPFALAKRLALSLPEGIRASAEICALRTDIAAKLTFAEVVEHVLPLTEWWRKRLSPPPPDKAETTPFLTLDAIYRRLLEQPVETPAGKALKVIEFLQNEPDRDKWQALFLILIVRACIKSAMSKEAAARLDVSQILRQAHEGSLTVADCRALWPPDAGAWTSKLSVSAERAGQAEEAVWTVSRNRKLALAAAVSRQTVKADASERVFELETSGVTWAVIDSGIDATHSAFRDRARPAAPGMPRKSSFLPAESRVDRTYDFLRLRKLLSWGLGSPAEFEELKALGARDEDFPAFNRIKTDANEGRQLDWALLEPLLRVRHDDEAGYLAKHVPKNKHGSHVAGIIGADIRANELADGQPLGAVDFDIKGMCPSIRLYDLRVCDKDGVGEEFLTIAAMQFVSFLNRNKDLQVVHGVNLSLSFDHEAANFACGRTPVCMQAERLVNDGVVVVAAAGNKGYQRALVEGGVFKTYAAMSITDPGNADSVITVGSTHKEQPHAYGVSYFSSRGPTGDGRAKPDILAPGEKILSAIPGGKVDYMDGTSMAAPHVSGAAAMLIARHAELRAQPRRIKAILLKAATDMGRDRSFQGAGLLDVLRALQSV